ncbi:MAG TPA: CGNR zinc finger domain-containing protein [Solirubrobacteraceae bacterium]|nr:CGNR zinc finger domain-containing protein [Solirubrobacteraceae bacterium]
MLRNAPRDLPDDLTLPLESGAPWWYWLGARPSVDLVNTRRERWRRNVETLVTPDDLALWLVHGGVAEDVVPVPASVVEEARGLREAIDACLTAVVEERPVPGSALTLIDDWLVHAGERPQLRLDGATGLPRLTERAAADSPRRMLGTIALDAARMLGSAEERARVRICASETCSARFYDRSPAGRRRWCSMQTCGNAAKARRHRARAKASA